MKLLNLLDAEHAGRRVILYYPTIMVARVELQKLAHEAKQRGTLWSERKGYGSERVVLASGTSITFETTTAGLHGHTADVVAIDSTVFEEAELHALQVIYPQRGSIEVLER